MGRAPTSILVVAVAALALIGGTFLTRTNSGHAPAPAAAAAPVGRPPVLSTANSHWPPLDGRIALTAEQERDATAAAGVLQPVRSLLKVESPMTYGNFVWNDRGVPSGRVWIRIDLKSQILSVFRSGHEIGTAVILYGTDGLPTPTGKFPILAKMKDHRSATYGDAPMPYTLRLTNDGVSIHGSNVRWGFATHGCVGVPKDFAAKLFDAVSTGDEVLIVSGKAPSKLTPES